MDLTHAISIVNWTFGKNIFRKHFFAFLYDFKLLMFHNNTVKISEILNIGNLLKACSRFTYPINSAYIFLQPFLQNEPQMEKNENTQIF